jgi:hypothetical protein
MTFSDWMKRSNIFTTTQRRLSSYSDITDVCRAAYKAGERHGRKDAKEIFPSKNRDVSNIETVFDK